MPINTQWGRTRYFFVSNYCNTRHLYIYIFELGATIFMLSHHLHTLFAGILRTLDGDGLTRREVHATFNAPDASVATRANCHRLPARSGTREGLTLGGG